MGSMRLPGFAVLAAVVSLTSTGCGRVEFDPRDAAGMEDSGPVPTDSGASMDSAVDSGPADSGETDADVEADSGGDAIVVDSGDAMPDVSVAMDPRLIAWYPMDDPPTAGRVRDATGNDHDGMCVDDSTCPLPVAGRVGGALAFDGVRSHVVVPDTGALGPSGGFTIAAWVWIDRAISALISKYDGAAGLWSYSLMAAPVGNGLMWAAGPSAGSIDGVLPLATWTHLTMTWDGGTDLRIYIDGSATMFPFVTTPTFDTSPLLLGTRAITGAAPTDFLEGRLDDVRIYDAVLTDAEIDALAAM